MNFTYEGDNRTWLFAFTHPDDEIATAALIRRLTRFGSAVHCAWSVAPPWREAEARGAMTLLGVPQDNLTFFRFPDGRACEHLADLVACWRGTVEKVKPTDIAVCAFESGHIDHDSTNFAVCSAAVGYDCRIFEYPLYHTYLTRAPILNRFATPSDEMRIALSQDEKRLKWKIAQQYPSQNIAQLLRWYTIAGWLFMKPRGLRDFERYRPLPKIDYLEPNLPTDLARRVKQSQLWKKWEQYVRAEINRQQSEEKG